MNINERNDNMISKIIKRDGREVDFDKSKITDAIFKAAQTNGGTDRDIAESIADKVVESYTKLNPSSTPTVEEIQDLVEKNLIEEGYAKTAKSYILYRNERSKIRDAKNDLTKVMNELTFSKSIDSDIKRENGNINSDTSMGTMLKYGSSVSKDFYQKYILEPEHSAAHRNGDIHIHDLDFYTLTTTCTQIDLTKLFTGGFSTGHGHLREPNDISSYAALACIAIQSNQNDQHGGQSIPKFDYDLAIGIRKTFIKKYLDNIIKGIIFTTGESKDDITKLVKGIYTKIKDNYNIQPILSGENEYQQKERTLLALTCVYTSDDKSRRLEMNDIEDIQKTAHKIAVEETDRATYQAMEGFVHNLNTMSSRAGAQVEKS